MEIWKPVKDYEGLYEVSNLGRVKSLSKEIRTGTGYRMTKEIILKAKLGMHGYFFVGIWRNSIMKNKKIHQLVAESFLNHKPDGTHKLVVDHINDIKTDNKVENLQIVTQRFNTFKTQGKGTSKYKGVSWQKACKKWVAEIRTKEKHFYLGLFNTELAAHQAYQNKLKEII